MNIFNYVFQSLDGQPLRLSRFQGQPVFVVNTASECGFTPQYAKLQRLYENYRESGMVVLAIPCNDFGEQEPGDEAAIAEFCESQYNIRFPVTAKYSVQGRDAHPLFRDLLDEYGADILPRWNFHKYLFDRRGELLEHWPGKVEPDDLELVRTIERNVASWQL
ncbi:MAG: glutathione peroxidase [Wenzhouxiangellaceae bacterium]